MRRTLVVVVVIIVLLPSIARAGEDDARGSDDDPTEDVRPVRYASVEINPLSPAVSRYGGQLQVALMGPLTFASAVARIDADSVKGWALEVGSRLYFGLAQRRADGSRLAHVWLAASYLADDLRAGPLHGERRGVALDLGVTARLDRGFYLLGGFGVAQRTADIPIADRFEAMRTTPRLLFAVGWGI